MGKIVRTIESQKVASKQRLCRKRLCVDLAENVHLHFRDIRLEFSVAEWEVFGALVAEATAGIKAEVDKGYKEGAHKQRGKWTAPTLKADSAYFPDRLQLEENANGSYHLHWNEFRLEMRPQTLAVFKRVISKANELGKGTMRLADLMVARHNGKQSPEPNQFEYVPITESIMYTSLRDNNEKQYTAFRTALLKGNKRGCKTWAQFQALYKDIKTNGFSADAFIELNSDSLTVGDGQHRAAILLVMYPDLEVKITAKKGERPQAHPCLPYEDMGYKG